MTPTNIIFTIIFIIGLGVFLGMIMTIFAITFETTAEIFDDKITKFKKRLKKKYNQKME